MITTTITDIRTARPCLGGYRKLVAHLGGIDAFGMDTPLPVSRVLDSNGMLDTLWVPHSNGRRIARRTMPERTATNEPRHNEGMIRRVGHRPAGG